MLHCLNWCMQLNWVIFQMQFALFHHEDGALSVTLASVALKPCNTIILLKIIWKEQVLIFKHFV